MKKLILIPTTLLLTSTTLVSMVSCNEQPQVKKYQFEFIGNFCTINGCQHLITQIEQGAKVEYTVSPDTGRVLSSIQNLPDGVSLEGNVLTIEKMNKPYTVNINAVVPLSIEGLEESYQCDIGVEGNTNKITVYLDDGESKTDVTDSTTFNLTSDKLVWDAANSCFSWSDEIDAGEYTIHITANYSDYISDTYTTKLKINSREPTLVCDGIIPDHRYEVTSSGPGEISPVTFWFLDAQIAKPTNVTKQIEMRQLMSTYVHWDGAGEYGRFYWDSIDGADAVSVWAVYTKQSKQYELRFNFTVTLYYPESI